MVSLSDEFARGGGARGAELEDESEVASSALVAGLLEGTRELFPVLRAQRERDAPALARERLLQTDGRVRRKGTRHSPVPRRAHGALACTLCGDRARLCLSANIRSLR